MPEHLSPAASRVQRVRHELRMRALEVRRTAQVSPQVRAVTLSGDALKGFHSPGFDDHIKLFLPAEGADAARRDYTPRRYDPMANELTLEFALHGDGPAAAWAARAQAGDRLDIGGPRGSFLVPADYAWHLLAGDVTALPAIARRLEELPAGSHAFAFIALDAADRRALATQARLQLHWLDDDAALIDAVRAFALPAGEGYAWCAGEAGTMAALRRLLVQDKGHSRHALRAAAYWKRGAVAHHETLDDAA